MASLVGKRCICAKWDVIKILFYYALWLKPNCSLDLLGVASQSAYYRWCDNCLFTTNARDWFIDTLEWTTALLYGSLHGLCIMAGVLKAHALTNVMRAQTPGQNNSEYCYSACAYCRAWRHMSHHLLTFNKYKTTLQINKTKHQWLHTIKKRHCHKSICTTTS